MSSGEEEYIAPGDIVAIRHGLKGKQEGLVIGSYYNYLGQQILEVRLDSDEIYRAHYPTVTHVRRTLSYVRPSPVKQRTVERRIYW